MAINCKSLMVGDWVKCHYNENEWITKVSSIYPDTIWVEDTEEFEGMELCEGQFESIPLTPEILEKNGFVKTYDNVYSIYQFRDESYSIMVQILSDNKYGVEIHNTISEKDDKGRNDSVTFARDWCSEIFIHELQHCLRLLKIEKKIEL